MFRGEAHFAGNRMLSVVVAALLIGQTPSVEERPPHPLAPSLLTPTKAENAAYKKAIDRLIDVEINKGSASAVREATRAVDELPPEAIFVLVDRFNYAANNEHSCPAVILAKKITSIVQRSGDAHLVSYVKENVGAGVAAKRHLGVLKDLQIACVVRRNQIQAAGIALQTGLNRPPASMSLAEMSGAVSKIPPARVPMFLAEAEKRKDPLKLDVLAIAAERKEKEVQTLARGMIRKQTDDASDSDLRRMLEHKRIEVRKAALASAESRGLTWGEAIIDRTLDDDATVRRAAYDILVRFNRGTAVAPWDDSSPGHRVQAAEKWREWLKSR
jgi:hypothetical protein